MINEGRNDPSIFKAVFLAGGPGSGKSFIVGKTGLPALGMRVVNSDDQFENAMKKAGMEMTSDNIFSVKGQELRGKAKALTGAKQAMYIKGRLGLVIDGTGKDYDKISKQVAGLKSLGYECYMIFVNTSLDTAQAQNKKRKRTLPETEVSTMWNEVQQNIGKFQRLFGGSSFIVVDNNMAGEDVFEKVWKRMAMLIRKKVANPIAKRWISQELTKKKR